ncbi:ABC transporter permease subunit [Actinomadura madurae]|uniref:ABC transporter permease n=1 Tax=Actinomadura madurae TaxID=1993 RepID=UPI0020D2116B|nr:ABC transporter permease subunit [Actinomadura madurae]MCP9948466.1 ABC transporter permease subunit [Actinomadura madurae]
MVVNSFGTRWFAGWLPQGFTSAWYSDAWEEFALGEVLTVTLEITLVVVALSLLIGVPAGYALARRDFPGKRIVMFLLLLPVLLPPITYGIPLATVLYKVHLAGTMTGVIAANLVPALPFVVLVMTPFVEQIDANVESAARMCGARTRQVFTRVLVPLLLPGILAARHPGAGPDRRHVRADVPGRRRRQPDADRLAVQRRVHPGHPRRPGHRRDGRDLHGAVGGPARDRPDVRQPDTDRRPGEGGPGRMSPAEKRACE